MADASQESIVVAQKFMQHMPAKSPRTRIGMGLYADDYGSRVTTDGQRLLSYDWWPIAYHGERDDVDGFDTLYITTDQYQTGEWKSGKPKYSPTTNGHIRAVTDAAHAAGFVTAHVHVERDGREYQLYTRKS